MTDFNTNTVNVSTDEVVSDNLRNVYNMQHYVKYGLPEDFADFAGKSECKSGFENLDAVMPLFPGLYVIGAIPSLGKTTFMLQICDQMAKTGVPVLFFSLEQSVSELVAKSFSRIISDSVPEEKYMTSVNVRKSPGDSRVTAAIEEYSKYAENIDIAVPGDVNSGNPDGFGMTMDYLEKVIEDYIERRKKVPVVIVDYLQIIQQPEGFRGDTRNLIDNSILRLKTLQRKHNMIVFVISSLNRSNYSAVIDRESFKESGGIEYSADVLLGLQLDIFDDAAFNKVKSKVDDKRVYINNAMAANPRKVELVCLKNRFGQSEFHCYCKYYKDVDKFVPVYKSTDDLNYAGHYDGNDEAGTDDIRYYPIDGNYESGGGMI